jgi:ECF sigma factor
MRPVASVVMSENSRLIDDASDRDGRAAAQLLPLVYDEWRKLASERMSAEAPAHTLNATALVHDASLRPIGDWHFEGRGRFFAEAEAMRRIPVNHARDRKRLEWGGGSVRLEPLDRIGCLAEDPDLVLSLDELLTRPGERAGSGAGKFILEIFGIVERRQREEARHGGEDRGNAKDHRDLRAIIGGCDRVPAGLERSWLAANELAGI